MGVREARAGARGRRRGRGRPERKLAPVPSGLKTAVVVVGCRLGSKRVWWSPPLGVHQRFEGKKQRALRLPPPPSFGAELRPPQRMSFIRVIYGLHSSIRPGGSLALSLRTPHCAGRRRSNVRVRLQIPWEKGAFFVGTARTRATRASRGQIHLCQRCTRGRAWHGTCRWDSLCPSAKK